MPELRGKVRSGNKGVFYGRGKRRAGQIGRALDRARQPARGGQPGLSRAGRYPLSTGAFIPSSRSPTSSSRSPRFLKGASHASAGGRGTSSCSRTFSPPALTSPTTSRAGNRNFPPNRRTSVLFCANRSHCIPCWSTLWSTACTRPRRHRARDWVEWAKRENREIVWFEKSGGQSLIPLQARTVVSRRIPVGSSLSASSDP